MLEVRDLTISYPSLPVLAHISFSLERTRTLAIVGKSGCGKSTLLSAIASTLIQAPHTQKKNSVTISGSIHWNKQNVLKSKGHARYMQQDDLLLPWLKNIANIALPLRICGTKKNIARQMAFQFMSHFQLEKYAAYYPSQLSGGMRQRIALLRTCIRTHTADSTSPLILLDEPFARLDMITKEECRTWATHVLKNISATTVLVTHDIEEAIKCADTILVIGGNVTAQTSSDFSQDRFSDSVSNYTLQSSPTIARHITSRFDVPLKISRQQDSLEMLALKTKILQAL